MRIQSSIHALIPTHFFLNSSPLDKMTTILQMIFSDAFSSMKFCILIKISLKFIPKGPIDHIPALV